MSCFICLEPCSISKCTTCSCVAHNKCWSNYVKDLKKKNNLVCCPICKININFPSTRSTTVKTRKKILVSELSILINEIGQMKISKEKMSKFRKLFNLLCEYKNTDLDLLSNEKFSNIVSIKLKEFSNEGWSSSEFYYKILFDKNIY